MIWQAFLAFGLGLVAWRIAPSGPIMQSLDLAFWSGFCALICVSGLAKVIKESPGRPTHWLGHGWAKIAIAGVLWLGLAGYGAIYGTPHLNWIQRHDGRGTVFCEYVGWNGFVSVKADGRCPSWSWM